MDIPTSEIYALAGPKPWEPVSYAFENDRGIVSHWCDTDASLARTATKMLCVGALRPWLGLAFRLANGQLVIVRRRSNVIPIHGKLNSETGSVTTFDVVRPGPRGAA